MEQASEAAKWRGRRGGDACELRYDLVERGALRSRLLSQLYDELTNTATDLTPLMAERLLTTYYQLLRDIQGDTIPAEPPPPPPPPKGAEPLLLHDSTSI